MEESLARLLAVVAMAGAFTIPLVQLVKAQGLPARFAPAASVVCGIVMVALLALAGVISLTLWETIFTGLVTGMTAAGVYSGGKAVMGKS